MHNTVKRFIKEVREDVPYKFRLRKVLEVGSHNINGSPRKYFRFCKYTGVDITKGKGVNVVGNFNDIKFNDKYGKPGGLMLMTCAGPERKEHGTKRTSPQDSPDTTDYYRNITKEDFREVLPGDLFECYVLMYGRGENDLQFWGIKNK